MVREITPVELKQKLSGAEPPVLLDVREQYERESFNIGGIHIPLGELAARASEIPKNSDVVVYCAVGARSAYAVEELQTRFGFNRLWNLKGGIAQWMNDVDPS
jgi:sulfur-carrier protein adenylyltransferase/sulfurtransferase